MRGDGRPGWAERTVLDHVLRTTRGLSDRIARDRFDQVVSDLWEQAASGRHRTSAAILWRALRGLPADVLWRAESLRATRTTVAPRPVLHIAGGSAVFDQTNGLFPFERPVTEERRDLTRLWAQALASNAVSSGMVGGNL